MNTKTFTNLDPSFFEHLQEERFSNVDDVEGVLTFHDVTFSFTYNEEELTVTLVTLPATFNGDELRAWELIKDFVVVHGGVEKEK